MVQLAVNLHGLNGVRVDGTIRRVTPSDALSWYGNWFPKMFDLAGRRVFEDSHWDVPRLWGHYSQFPSTECLVIEAKGQIQAFVIFQYDGYIGLDNLPCGYVSFIAVAPWNRAAAQVPTRFVGLGKLLLAVCGLIRLRRLKISVNDLRLELESLSQAEMAYLKIGFAPTGHLVQMMNQYRLDGSAVLSLITNQVQFIAPGGTL